MWKGGNTNGNGNKVEISIWVKYGVEISGRLKKLLEMETRVEIEGGMSGKMENKLKWKSKGNRKYYL